MAEDIFSVFGGLIEASKENMKNSNPRKSNATWKHCVILHSTGWSIASFERVNEEDNDDVIIIWRKEGKEDIKMRLPFSQQCLWVEYAERKHKEKNNGK